MLYRFRGGDANMRSVLICSRNDALGNLAVLMAAMGVFGTGTGWPDVMGTWPVGRLANHGHARSKLQTERLTHVVMAAE